MKLRETCPFIHYCKTGNCHVQLVLANFAIIMKLISINIFAHHYNRCMCRESRLKLAMKEKSEKSK